MRRAWCEQPRRGDFTVALALAVAALFAAFESAAAAPALDGGWRADPPSVNGASAPNLTEDGAGALATWLEPGARPASTALRFARFDGQTWSKPVTVTESSNLVVNWADVPSVARASKNGLVAHWAEKSGEAGHAYDVRLARSDDNGGTWRPLRTPHHDGREAEHGFVSLAAEGNAVRVTWVDGRDTLAPRNGPSTLRTTLLGDAGVSDVVADDRICDCCGTAAAAVDGGTLVVYRNRLEDETRDIWAVRLSGGRIGQPHPVHRDGWVVPGCPVNGPALAARGDHAVVVWYTYARSEPMVRASFSSNGGESFGPVVKLAATSGRSAPVGRVDVALLSSTEAVATWMMSTREDATLQAARFTSDGRAGLPTALSTTRSERQAGFAKLARVGDRLLVMWTDAGPPSSLRALLFDPRALPPPHAPDSAPAKVVASPVDHSPRLDAFVAKRLDGGTAASSELAGKWALVNVWATWCEPCRMELPVLNRLARTYGPRGLFVVGISVDRDKSDAEVEAFARRRDVAFPIWRDRDERAAALLGVTVLPRTLLIDPAGRVVFSRDGALTDNEPELDTLLQQIKAGTDK